MRTKFHHIAGGVLALFAWYRPATPLTSVQTSDGDTQSHTRLLLASYHGSFQAYNARIKPSRCNRPCALNPDQDGGRMLDAQQGER
ncbi:hypothetical protein GY45DRAFT_970750 [Cubamyces sp. BRFM 1775]|nr:hypothetical protein GY45DRAFT_970750 [Cubamyces sp. BRFM 1775]